MAIFTLTTSARRARPARAASAQRGATLLFALLALVSLSLATIALVRSVDSGTLVLGNLGFKKDATAYADRVTQEAIDWVTGHQAELISDQPASGYYASARPELDVTGLGAPSKTRDIVDWDGDDCASTDDEDYRYCVKPSSEVEIDGSKSKNEARYIVMRMSTGAGEPGSGGNTFLKPFNSSSGTYSQRGEKNYAENAAFTTQAGPYYRVVVRVRGARGTTSFTETIIHF